MSKSELVVDSKEILIWIISCESSFFSKEGKLQPCRNLKMIEILGTENKFKKESYVIYSLAKTKNLGFMYHKKSIYVHNIERKGVESKKEVNRKK